MVVLVDNDGKDCLRFKAELTSLRDVIAPRPGAVVFRIAVQEIEAPHLALDPPVAPSLRALVAAVSRATGLP